MSCSEMQEGLIIENGVEIGGVASNPLASAEKQCELLLVEIEALKELNHKLAHENGTLKRGREIQRDIMGECAMALDNIKIYPRLNLEIDIDSIKIIQDVIKKLNGEK